MNLGNVITTLLNFLPVLIEARNGETEFDFKKYMARARFAADNSGIDSSILKTMSPMLEELRMYISNWNDDIPDYEVYAKIDEIMNNSKEVSDG